MEKEIFNTLGAIVADPEEEGGPLEIWVDWDPYTDHARGTYNGMAKIVGNVLLVDGGLKIRQFEGLAPDVLEDIYCQGGRVITANSTGVVSVLNFGVQK